jgi:hypothetical protein
MGKAWYQYPFDNPQGAIEPYGGGPKPDSNVQCPAGTPITVILPGTISGLNAPDGSMPAWGAVVTIRLDTPVNTIATHTAYLHLAPLPSSLRVGQHVNAGTVIGYSGGPGAAGAQKVPVGFALYNGDVYGFGASWSQYVGNPLLNPYGILTAASGGHLNIPASSGGSGSTLTDTMTGAVTRVAPNADVTTLLYVLDQVLLLTNPFKISGVQQDSIAGVSFTDPVAWAQQFGQNVIDDFSAGIIRLLFILLGLFILYKVASTFIDPSAVTQTAVSGAATVGKLAAMGAPAGV